MSLTGCFNTRFLEDGQVLFKKNEVRFEKDKKVEEKATIVRELKDISQLQPNHKLLGLFKSRLWFYNIASQGKRQSKLKYWLKNKVGEPPVLYDSTLAAKSTVLMQNYLLNKGHFYSDVGYETWIKRKKATITYQVKSGSLYRINEVTFPQSNDRIAQLIRGAENSTLLRSGEPFDIGKLKSERERIDELLKNNGYFYFNKEFVSYDLDSSKLDRAMDVHVRINPPTDSTWHELYYIRDIYIYTDFSVEKLKSTVDYDTLNVGEYHFIYERLRYRPDVLIHAIHFVKGELYSKLDNKLTINHLVALGVFRFVNVKFQESEEDGKNYLDCIIYLTPAKRQEVALEAEANNNTDYVLGLGASFTYRNKNIFGGAELFEFNLSSGFESNLQRDLGFFNTVDLVGESSIYFNKFIVPFRLQNISKNARPKTRISVRYNFLKRINYYTINSTSLSFGYDWKETQTKRHIYNPIVANLVRVNEASQEFKDVLERSQTLKNSFTEQLILGSDYSYIWSNQAIKKGRTFFFFKGEVDLAGNFIQLGSELLHANRAKPETYTIGGINYAQFAQFSADGRNYFQFKRNTMLVSRLYGGIGIPYGNSKVLPYVKQYFSGGSNGIRAWRVRTLGPGSFNVEESDEIDESGEFFFDQTGDIKLEGNLELRFDLIAFLKGAVFLDAGNVWTLQPDTLRPGADFAFDRFANEIALGMGVGLRIDFTYFVLRFDLGIPVRDPAPDDKWVIKNFSPGSRAWRRENLKLNLAIGYPF